MIIINAKSKLELDNKHHNSVSDILDTLQPPKRALPKTQQVA